LEIPGKTQLIRPILERDLSGRSDLTFLDVGCGMGGYMLAASRLGFRVVGCEPSAAHARVAKDVFGFPVINGYFTPDKVDTSFDLIMLSHVIEHIYDQQAFLGQLLQVLKPGGILIVVTPNASSAVARICGRYWPMLKTIDHVSLISATAYEYFVFTEPVEIRHSWSGYSFEFAGTLAAALRDRMRKVGSEAISGGRSKVMRSTSWRSRILKAGLTAASLPAHLLPEHRQPCLITQIRREG
jgi:SAM-dependent methyltransferase